MDANTEYLGDSVYASFDGVNITLETRNGLPSDPSNRIYLDPSVWEALLRFQQRVSTG